MGKAVVQIREVADHLKTLAVQADTLTWKPTSQPNTVTVHGQNRKVWTKDWKGSNSSKKKCKISFSSK
ncbi:hypothetical protein Goklo_000119 [Gossypium klotzschianum]|uniref:Uncharacterized protein n=1 Tax=Gossypium klotzschianum TaxID=34286 RepID=A0A7J8W725_9ROSI|nr:hypothetical protein [Gossypium klotzschianum]